MQMLDWYIALLMVLPGVLYYFFINKDVRKSVIFLALFNVMWSVIFKFFGEQIKKFFTSIPALMNLLQNSDIALFTFVGLITALLFYIATLIMQQTEKAKTLLIMSGVYSSSMYLAFIALQDEILGRGASASEVFSGIGSRWDALVGWFRGLDTITYIMVIAGIIFLVFAFAKASER